MADKVKKYRVVHSQAGEFGQNSILTEEELRASGGDFEFWLAAGAIREEKEVLAGRTEPRSRAERMGEVNAESVRKAAFDEGYAAGLAARDQAAAALADSAKQAAATEAYNLGVKTGEAGLEALKAEHDKVLAAKDKALAEAVQAATEQGRQAGLEEAKKAK